MKKKGISFFDEFQPIIIFFLIFIFYSFVLNFLILIDFYNFFNIIFYLIIIIQIIFFSKNIEFLKSKNFKSFYGNKIEKFIILFFFLFFLIAILPISDADSIALHQNLANTIYQNGLGNINFNQSIAFTIFSNTQTLLIISPILNSDNFGSQFNLATLIFFIFINIKNNKNFLIILFSCPLIIYFISVQKLQLFFGLLYLMIFVLINKKLIRKKLEIFIIILLLGFYASGNLSYILFAAPLYIYFFYTYKRDWKNIIFYSLITFIITLFPLFTIKEIYFHNFLAPVLDNIFGTNNFLYNAYSYSLRATEGWLSDISNFELYLRPFIPLSISNLSSSLGIIFLLMLLDRKLLKKTKFFPLIIIGIVIATGQILPRYYFEAFLILAYYFDLRGNLSKIVVTSHNIMVSTIALVFLFISYINFGVIKDSTKYMSKFSYNYYNSLQFKSLKLDGNILDFSLDRPSIFLEENVYSIRNLTILQKYKFDNKHLIKFISENKIKYIIINDIKDLPECLLIKKINETTRKKAVRNFFKKQIIDKYNVMRIVSNSCIS